MNTIKSLASLMTIHKVTDIEILDFKHISFFVDYYIIGTIQSESHGNLIIKKILDFTKTNHLKIFASNKQNNTGWLILDFGDFMIHLFTKEKRDYYNIENLWSEAKILEVSS